MKFGGKKDLLLLDNNVLVSCQFDEIIDEIKQAGFKKGSMYQPPNMFELTVQNLKEGYNDKGYIRCAVKLYRELVKKYGEKIQSVYDILESKGLLEYHTAKKEAIFETYDDVKELFEEMSKKKSRWNMK